MFNKAFKYAFILRKCTHETFLFFQLSNLQMGGTVTKTPPPTPKSPVTKKFITPKHEIVDTRPKKDLFKEVNNEVSSIQKSMSRTNVNRKAFINHVAAKNMGQIRSKNCLSFLSCKSLLTGRRSLSVDRFSW